jgi:hypothetical protein
MEFKHSSGKDGPNLKNRLKAMIEQTHFFQTLRIRKKHAYKRLKVQMGRQLRRPYFLGASQAAVTVLSIFYDVPLNPVATLGKQTFASLGSTRSA